MSAPTTVVLDDDPTGTQAVAGVPIVTTTDATDIAWAFDTSPRGFFVLTNSRSLDEVEMNQLTREIVRVVLEVAAGRPVRFVSRSDSTLRGHVYAEPEAIRSALREYGAREPRTVLFAPAFPAAGRVTRRGIHFVRDESGRERPAHESAYARDATFGYASAALADIVATRASGRIDRSDVALADSSTPEALADALAQPGWVVADAADDADLEALVRAIESVDPEGGDIVVRCSPGLLPALFGLPAAPQAAAGGSPARHGGLVIVGSHVPRTTRQLERLLADGGATLLTLDVAGLRGATAEAVAAIVDDIARTASSLLEGTHVVLATSRTVQEWDDPAASLAFARRVSETLVAIARALARGRELAFVVAKGGITSSDIATKGLAIRRAICRGRVGAGILWEPVGGDTPPIALVPGNIGDDNGLAEAVRQMSRQRSVE